MRLAPAVSERSVRAAPEKSGKVPVFERNEADLSPGMNQRRGRNVPLPTPEESGPTPCPLTAVVVPTVPAEIPGYTELDPSTDLHMTGSWQEIELEAYRLEITGKVDRPLSLTYDELRCMPKVERRLVLVCPGFFEDTATWAGASLQRVLELARVQLGVKRIKMRSADGYAVTVEWDEIPEDGFLAYEWEDEPLPILHGFPVRAVFPEVYGNKWVKWLVEIEVY